MFVGDRNMTLVKLNIKLASEVEKVGSKIAADGAGTTAGLKNQKLNAAQKKALDDCGAPDCPDVSLEKK